ncbi:hypothetical protein BDZ89DRAFT_1037123 [Hymenopellis radicata]|nr:hypothetical protein BDZ89DRAFT_1037123 [Hymenopellis radicata]
MENIKIAAQLAVLQEPVLPQATSGMFPPNGGLLSKHRPTVLGIRLEGTQNTPNRLSRPPSQRSHRILKKGAVTFAAVLVAERRPPNCQNLGTLGWALPHVLCTVVLMPYISSRAVVKRPTELRPGYRHPRSNKQTNRLTQGIRVQASEFVGEGLSISAGSTVSSSVVRATFATWSSLSDFDKRSVLFDFPSRSFHGHWNQREDGTTSVGVTATSSITHAPSYAALMEMARHFVLAVCALSIRRHRFRSCAAQRKYQKTWRTLFSWIYRHVGITARPDKVTVILSDLPQRDAIGGMEVFSRDAGTARGRLSKVILDAVLNPTRIKILDAFLNPTRRRVKKRRTDLKSQTTASTITTIQESSIRRGNDIDTADRPNAKVHPALTIESIRRTGGAFGEIKTQRHSDIASSFWGRRRGFEQHVDFWSGVNRGTKIVGDRGAVAGGDHHVNDCLSNNLAE